MEDGMVFGIVFIVLGLLIGAATYAVYRDYRKMNKTLNRALEMSGRANGTICELVTVRRRNQSFRWKNEYPIIAYEVNGKTYQTELTFAEKRKGGYSMGGNYTVCYALEDPKCCIVEEFRSKMQSARTMKLVLLVILVIFMINVLFSGFAQLLGYGPY